MSAIIRSKYDRQWERLGCTRCVNCYTRAGAYIVISICINEGYSLYHFVFGCLTMSTVLFVCIAFEMIGRLSWWRLVGSTEIHIFEI